MPITALELATQEDAEYLQELALEAFADDFKLYGAFPPNIESLNWFLTEIKAGNFYRVVHGNKLAGGICVECGESNSIEVKYVYIGLGFQNKRIGSLVMGLIEKQYKDIAHWTLFTPYKAYRNHHFYETLGYVKVGEFHPDPDDEFKVFEYVKDKALLGQN